MIKALNSLRAFLCLSQKFIHYSEVKADLDNDFFDVDK